MSRGLVPAAIAAALLAPAAGWAQPATATLSLDQPGYKRVFSILAPPPVSGSYSGPAGDIRCRVVAFAHRTQTIVPWQTVASVPAASTSARWSGAVTGWPVSSTGSAARWDSLQCQFHTARTPFTKKLGVGLVIAIMGQSNADRMFIQNNGDAAGKAYKVSDFIGYQPGVYGGDQYYDLASYQTTYGQFEPAGPPEGAAALGNILVAQTHAPVAFIKTSQGNTQELDWTSGYPNPPDCRCFDNAVKLINAYVGPVDFVFWRQGESNTGTTNVDTFQSRESFLQTVLIPEIQAQITVPKTHPWLLMGTLGITPTVVNQQAWTDIRNADLDETLKTPSVAVWTGNMLDISNWPGNIHWEHYDLAGARIAQAALYALGLAPADARGPTIDHWTLTDVGAGLSHVTIYYKLNAGAAIASRLGGAVDDISISADGGATWTVAAGPFTVTSATTVEGDLSAPAAHPSTYRLETDLGALPGSNQVVDDSDVFGFGPLPAQPTIGAAPPAGY